MKVAYKLALIAAVFSTAALADQPGRGRTAQFEIGYLKFIADHHYSALRMTELAAGTDEFREAAVTGEEGTAPTPGTQFSPPKAESPDLRSMARRNNRMQREEILTAQTFLKEWYGIDYQPHVRGIGQAQIQLLEAAPAGKAFDHLYMEVLSRHHFRALEPSARCQVASDPAHERLHRYCSGIVHSQLSDIENMREMLCKQFEICDYQPTVGLKGRHSGADGAVAVSVPEEEQPL